MRNKGSQRLQEDQYVFPYHHIPHFADSGAPSLVRVCGWWGFEYLCYQTHLLEKVVKLRPSSVLDVGCGDGVFIGNLPWSISRRIGIDTSARALAFAKAFFPDCAFYHQDISFVEERFDVITAIEVLEHLKEDQIPSFLRAMASKLNCNGCIIISVPTKAKAPIKKHYRHYDLDTLKRQIENSGITLRILKTEYIFSKPSWFRVCRPIFKNRLWTLEVKYVSALIWSLIWTKHRFANSKNGYHLIAELK